MIKLVLFDMDGVLVDACEAHRQTFRQACADYGQMFTAEYERELEGRPTRTKLAMLGIDRSLAETIQRRKQELTLARARTYRPEPERADLLRALRTAGVGTACVTNSIRETSVAFLSSAGLFEHLDDLVTNEDVERAKPDPQGYLRATARARVTATPNETLVLEDSPVGLSAAYASGAKVLPVQFDLLTQQIPFLKFVLTGGNDVRSDFGVGRRRW